MKYSPYPKYKDSGVAWLGKVPEHWEVQRLRFLASYQNSNVDKKNYEGQEQVRLCNYTDVYYNEKITDDLNFMLATASESEIETMKLHIDDVIITKDSEDPSDIGIPAIVSENLHNVVCGYHLTVIRAANKATARFIHRAIQSNPSKAQFHVESPGITRFGLNQDTIGNLWVATPPLNERELVASLLDSQTASIDALITKKTRFIDLLKEKRLALITHAITKGLNPHVTMKDSRVEWIGEVPEHWEITRNKVAFFEVDDRNDSDNGELLTVSHLTGITPRSEKNVNMFLAETLNGYKKCMAGDLVINTMWAWMGALGVSPIDGLVSPSYNAYRLRNQTICLPRYYDYLCRIPEHVVYIKAHSTGVWESRLRLYPETFLDMRTCFPPVEEQRDIVAFLDRETVRIDALLAKTQRSIDLLRERRSALITAAVTGKIDIRKTGEKSA